MTNSYEAPATLVDLLRRRALQQPDLLMYTFLEDGATTQSHLTCAHLDRKARAIAAHLQRLGIVAGRVLLLYPPGLEFVAAFFGCLYAGVVATPVYPPHPTRVERTLPRFRAIAKDLQPAAVLTTSSFLALSTQVSASAPELGALPWLATERIDEQVAELWQPPALSPSSFAFFQYTSGSTAAPKGVMLTHSNVLYNSSLIERSFEHTPQSRGVIWLPLYHDMGLIGGVIQPLYGGFPVTLLSPMAFIQTPRRWLQAISRFRATTSGGPMFAYELCIRKITAEQRATLDLSSWEVAFTGAEPVRPETLERFTAAFAPCGFRREAFYPCYGLAEATLIVSGGLKGAPPVICSVQSSALEQHVVAVATTAQQEEGATQRLVGCGSSRWGQKIVIVNTETRRACSANEVGEIWVAGPSVAQGYWNQPEETERTYRAYVSDTGEGPFLRTGDLGFLREGELFVTGRVKDLIIIDGRNYYPQDIELTVEQSHPAVRQGGCAAFAVEIEGEERLVIAAEVHRRLDAEAAAVISAIKRAVVEFHELGAHEIVLLKAGSLSKTSSGKIQRHACRANFLTGNLHLIDGEER